MTRAALYLRVSTDEQTTENQRRELEALAERRGWSVVEVFEDAGVSGAKGRDKRPGLDRAMKAATRGKIDVLMAWSIDRLGRSLQGLVETIEDLRAAGVGLYLHQQAVDTTTPSGKAMVQMCGVFAEFERAMIQERVKSGLARAVAQGKTLGRPRVPPHKEEHIRRLLLAGTSVHKAAQMVGVGAGTVQRIKASLAPPADAGSPADQPPVTDRLRQSILHRHAAGKTVEQIQKALRTTLGEQVPVEEIERVIEEAAS
ncbi:recombinase family protein (plasmid) [Azospirillum sp. HJ39]|uniref:recombinase family protein n=1 Tax=Azospirillum sp. HJ39 TaxID=3159496 RepID=UPI0035566FA2